jgi:hypothetical protein
VKVKINIISNDVAQSIPERHIQAVTGPSTDHKDSLPLQHTVNSDFV